MSVLAAMSLAAMGCGGVEVRAEAPGPGAEAAAAEEATEAAALAWAALDPERAAREAERALRLGGGRDAAEIAARAHLARWRFDAAIRATAGTDDPVLLRLRARAQLAAGDLRAAEESLAAAARHDREEDAWATSMLAPVRRAARAPAYVVSGERAELALEDHPLPVVRVQLDAVETLAVIGSGVAMSVLDPSVRSEGGAIDELTLGALRVANVPHTVRSLEVVRAALGADVGMVIGADLLLLLGATLDGPGRRLVLSREPPARPDTSHATLSMLTGSFLAIEAHRGDSHGFLTVDTAGLFPIALSAAGVEALGLERAAWEATGAPGADVAVAELRLGSMEVEGVPVVRGLVGAEHAQAIGAPVAGALGWGLLSQLVVTFDARARRLRFEGAGP